MQRYFVNPSSIEDGVCTIQTSDVHHIRTVMRFTIGDFIIISQNGGPSYFGKIEMFSEKSVRVLLGDEAPAYQIPYSVTLAQALIRKDAFELVVEKATELGVKALIPTLFKHSIVKFDSEKELKKIIRYQTIAKEASEQSERASVPRIENVTKLTDIDYSRYDTVLFCYEREAGNQIKDVISSLDPQKEILILVGPEGGIAPAEKAFLESLGARSVSLGKPILRSETAGIMALSCFLYEWGIVS